MATATDIGPGDSFVPQWMIVVLFVGTAAVSFVVLYSLWALWPDAAPPRARVQQFQDVNWFGWRYHAVQRETLFFLIVALGGALGGLIHTTRSITKYVGNREFRWSWVPYNLTLPLVGALGGTVFYIVLRAGLFSPSTSVSEASPFGFCAVALLVGLFSEQAMEKLREVAGNVFTQPEPGKDSLPPVVTESAASEAGAAPETPPVAT